MLLPLDSFLGTRSKIRLLRALYPLSRAVSGREAARVAGLSHHAIEALEELVSCGILIRQESSGQHLYTFNRHHELGGAIAALFQAEDEYWRSLIAELASVLRPAPSLVSAVIFGSAARGETRAGSDLDLLVLVSDDESGTSVHDALVVVSSDLWRRFGVRLAPVVITAQRARAQYRSGGSFLQGALRDARAVAGQPLAEVLDGPADA